MSKKFEPYITAEAAEEGLLSGKFASGVLRVNPKKPNDAFCVTGSSDILIRGKYDRNRGFNGDTVVVEIFPEADWHRSTKEEEEEGMDLEVRGALGVSVPEEDKAEILLSASDFQKLSGGMFAAAPKLLTTPASVVPPTGVIKTGKVVYVAKCVWKERTYACSLQPNKMDQGDSPVQEISESDTIIRAVPVDKRIPWILIQLNDVVKKTLKLPGKLDRNILYPIQVQKWNENGALPLGRLKGVAYGRVGQPEVEAKVCMAEQGLEDHEEDFPKSVYDEVEAMQTNFWQELEQEASKRIDLRKKRIFTIDPLTARDLDDAIHVDIINDEFVEVGVHIADVSHYVKEGSQVCFTSTDMRTYNDEKIDSFS
jgi:exoribonuclease R